MANPLRRKLSCERLEDRRLLAVVTVDTVEDIVDLTDGRTSLREAIFATNTVPGADEIVFDFDRRATILLTQGELQITDSLTISGPGAELLTIDASGNDPTPDSTYQDGDETNDGDGSRIFAIGANYSRNHTVRIQGLSLTGADQLRGSAIAAWGTLELEDLLVTENSGGAAVFSAGSLTMDRTSVLGNSGGGIEAEGGLTVLDSLISNNHTPYNDGGGISVIQTSSITVTIRNSSITDNFGRFGGGVYARGEVLIENTAIERNTSRYEGGGVNFTGGQLSINFSSIIGNSAESLNGGGIYSRNSTTSVHDSVITDNSAYKFGGGIYSEGTLEVVRSRVSGNEARLVGGIVSRGEINVSESVVSNNNGGVLAYGRTNNISDSTISGNTEFGGIFLSDGSILDLSNSTVSGNSSRYEGGGIRGKGRQYISHSTITNNTTETGNGGGIYGSQIRLDHSIVAGNFDGSGVANDVAGEVTNSFSLLGEGADFLGPLADNGGPTRTHALLPGSPAINAGDLNAVAGEDDLPEFDQRGEGFDRIVSRIDIGAYEVQTLGDMNLVVDTLVDESGSDFSPGDLSLREAIELANANPVPDTISFFPFLPTGASQRTVLLTEGELVIRDDLKISGAGLNRIMIDASGNDPTPGQDEGDGSRVFRVDDLDSEHEIEVTLSELTITGGDVSGVGGGILSHEKLTLESVVVDSNFATVAGGGLGLLHDATLKDQTLIADNFAARGGGVSTVGRTLHIADSVIRRNQSTESGGGILAESGAELQLTNASVRDNRSLGESSSGGGIDLSDSSLFADRSYFSSNFAARGGGIWSENSIVALRDSTMSGNTNTVIGGAIAAKDSQIEIEYSELRNNGRRGLGGGALDAAGGQVTVRNSVFRSNVASSYLGGGAIAISGSQTPADLEIVSTEFLSNAAGSGGAIHIAGGVDASIRESVFSGNRAGHPEGNGGAIDSQSIGEVLITKSEFLSNHARQHGGAIHAAGSITVDRSLVRDNEATWAGGGVYAVVGNDEVVSIRASTLSLNHSAFGGGFAAQNFAGIVELSNSTVAENTASFSGGGIYFGAPFDIVTASESLAASAESDFSSVNRISYSTITDNNSDETGPGLVTFFSEVQLSHTIVYGNGPNRFAPDVLVSSDNGQPVMAEFSLIGTIEPGTPVLTNQTLLGVDPLLRGPANNVAHPGSVYVLGSGSPAINAGDPALVQGDNETPEFDQRGAPFARVANGRIDLGAYEIQAANGDLTGDYDSGGDVNGQDFLLWQRGFGLANATLADGDATWNGSIDENDLRVWEATYSRQVSNTVSTSNAIDFALAAEFTNQRATVQPTRGPVARRTVYARAEVITSHPMTTNNQPRRVIIEHAPNVGTSSNAERAGVSFALDEALSELFAK